jgi:hypothetical protein
MFGFNRSIPQIAFPSLRSRKYSVWFLRSYLSPFLYYLRSHTDLERGAAIPKLL